jgi:ATP-binding cassette subfamily B protein
MDDATQIDSFFLTRSLRYTRRLTVLIMGVMMFIYTGGSPLPFFLVIPVAFLIFWLSRKYQTACIPGFTT